MSALARLAHGSARPTLGPWVLGDELGRGGMGVVWRGTHAQTGRTAAVKVLSVGRTVDPSRGAQVLRSEVELAARLSHPGIVEVLGYGRVSSAAAALTDGELIAGSSWVAMEVVEGDTLEPLCGQLTWPEIHRILLSILDALAHAHARGVVHLDLKPANVMLAEGDPPTVKLTDFGLARAWTRRPDRSDISGSPAYMAPEQFTGDWRDFGPWTDLYALGCLATELIQGSPPFGHRAPAALGLAHQRDTPPSLVARTPIPDGAEAWRMRLLQKAPADRFGRAADAAWSLRQLDAPSDGPAPPPRAVSWLARALTLDGMLALAPAAPPAVTASLAPIRTPPTPETGRVPESHRPLGSAALFAHREVPLLGREREQDAAWAALHRVVHTGRGAVLEVSSASGIGGEGLCRWLAQRAAELAVATPLRLRPEAGGGLADAMAWFTRCGGLRPRQLRSRLEERLVLLELSEETLAGLSEAIATSADLPVATAMEALRGMTRERPSLLWTRATSDSARAVDLASHLQGVDMPVLVLIESDPAEVAAHPHLQKALAPVRTHPDYTRVDLPPLPTPAMWGLVQLLNLEDGVARSIRSRANGSAELAVQLVGHWIEQGLLFEGTDGITARPGRAGAAPASALAPWKQRLARLSRDCGTNPVDWLQIAAVLGHDGPLSEWAAARTAQGEEGSAAELAELETRGFLAPTEPGRWRLASPSLREALLDDLGEAERLLLHAVCADIVPADASARRGRHLVAAGRAERACPALLEGAQLALTHEDHIEAQDLLALWESTLRALAVPETDPRWAKGLVLGAEAFLTAGDYPHALERVQAARLLVDAQTADAALRVRARLAHASSCLGHGRYDEALQLAIEARALAEAAGRPELAASALWRQSFIARFQGQRSEADRLIGLASAAYEAVGDLEGLCRVQMARGVALAETGEFEQAKPALERAVELHRELGAARRAAACASGLVAVCRYGDDLDGADHWARVMVELLSVRAPPNSWNLLNIAITDLARHDDRAWYALLGRLPAGARHSTYPLFTQRLRAYSLVAGAPSLTDERFEALIADLHTFEAGALGPIDTAHCAELAARAARRGGRTERADRLGALAAGWWRKVGREDYAQRAEAECPRHPNAG